MHGLLVLQDGCINGLQNNNHSVSYLRHVETSENGTYRQIDPMVTSLNSTDITTTLSSAERNDLINSFEVNNNALKSAIAKYNGLIDGGNANKLILDIKNKWSKDATTLQKNLLTLSPNLSESVLMEVAQLGVLSQSVLMEILLANVSSSKNKLFLEALKNNIPNPLTNEQIERLKSTAIPSSTRLDLEIQINVLKGEVMGMGRQLISDIYKSKGKYPVDSLRYWFSKLNSPEAYYDLAETHIKGVKSNVTAVKERSSW